MCCTPTISKYKQMSGILDAASRSSNSGEFSVPLCIPESFVSTLGSFMSMTNNDEVIFLGKIYKPKTIRFLNFNVTKISGIYFYGLMLLDLQANKAVGEVSFYQLQELVYG